MIKIDIFTNLITPFDIDDMIDYQALDNHIEKLVNQGNNKFIIGSRTGEAASLTFLEQKHLLRYVCYHYPGLEIYMQLSESCTKKVIKQIGDLKDINEFAGYMIELPEIFSLTQNGLIKHLDLIATATNKSIVIQQHKQNTIAVNHLLELKEKHENITGLITEVNSTGYQIIRNKGLGLYGIEEMLVQNEINNYDGLISNLTNLSYKKYRELITQHNDLYFDFFKLIVKYFYQDNIVSTLKYSLSQSSNILYKLRLPLVKISDESKEQLNKIMEKY